MELKVIESSKAATGYDLTRVYVEKWQLQIEASSLKDEPNNSLHIIFPSKIEHCQVTNETYKTALISRIDKSIKDGKCHGGRGPFFEVLSVEEYSHYLQEDSDELFLFIAVQIYIFIYCFLWMM